MTLWRANCVRRISADSRTFIYFTHSLFPGVTWSHKGAARPR
jgi:hypothetical protein